MNEIEMVVGKFQTLYHVLLRKRCIKRFDGIGEYRYNVYPVKICVGIVGCHFQNPCSWSTAVRWWKYQCGQEKKEKEKDKFQDKKREWLPNIKYSNTFIIPVEH